MHINIDMHKFVAFFKNRGIIVHSVIGLFLRKIMHDFYINFKF